MIELKARITDGRLGTASHCESAQASPTGLSMDPNYWRSDPQEAPAGAMTATGVHSVDLLIHLFGRIDEVYCLSHRRVMARLEDTTAVLFGLANGMSATLYCSLVTAVSARFASARGADPRSLGTRTSRSFIPTITRRRGDSGPRALARDPAGR